MSTDPRANVGPQGCDRECRSTFRYEYGGAMEGGPFPGTMADPDDVRRCEHGRIWIFTETVTGYFYNRLDLWRPISRWWEPIAYRRAARALRPAPVSERTPDA